jgi:hypothetical protein
VGQLGHEVNIHTDYGISAGHVHLLYVGVLLFFSATIFLIQWLDHLQHPFFQGDDGQWKVSEEFWIYWASAIPLTSSYSLFGPYSPML